MGENIFFFWRAFIALYTILLQNDYSVLSAKGDTGGR